MVAGSLDVSRARSARSLLVVPHGVFKLRWCEAVFTKQLFHEQLPKPPRFAPNAAAAVRTSMAMRPTTDRP